MQSDCAEKTSCMDLSWSVTLQKFGTAGFAAALLVCLSGCGAVGFTLASFEKPYEHRVDFEDVHLRYYGDVEGYHFSGRHNLTGTIKRKADGSDLWILSVRWDNPDRSVGVNERLFVVGYHLSSEQLPTIVPPDDLSIVDEVRIILKSGRTERPYKMPMNYVYTREIPAPVDAKFVVLHDYMTYVDR